MPTRKEFMSDNVETKYRCIMDIAKTLSMEEIQVLEKMKIKKESISKI